MKTLGILLMGTSLLPLTYNLMNSTVPEVTTVYALLLVFLAGLGILVHYSRVTQHIDEPSVMVVRAIFSHGFELLGGLMAVFAALSLMLMFILTKRFDAWQMPAAMLLLGVFLMLMFSVHISDRKKKHASRMGKKKR